MGGPRPSPQAFPSACWAPVSLLLFCLDRLCLLSVQRQRVKQKPGFCLCLHWLESLITLVASSNVLSRQRNFAPQRVIEKLAIVPLSRFAKTRLEARVSTS